MSTHLSAVAPDAPPRVPEAGGAVGPAVAGPGAEPRRRHGAPREPGPADAARLLRHPVAGGVGHAGPAVDVVGAGGALGRHHRQVDRAGGVLPGQAGPAAGGADPLAPAGGEEN